ncbi:hypothetical protein ACTFIR_002437 [Dictyostelium discoideum]
MKIILILSIFLICFLQLGQSVILNNTNNLMNYIVFNNHNINNSNNNNKNNND